MLDFETIKQSKAQKLRYIADELLKLNPNGNKILNIKAKSITPELPPQDLIQEIYEWEKAQDSKFVYYFSLPHNADFERIHSKVTAAKKNKVGGRAYPRINSPSKYLYVGSSKEIAKRFREHLGYGYKGTYAMNLAYWCSNFEINIEFFCMGCNPNINSEVIQAFEDGLWDHLRPLLGRQGAR